MSANPIVGAWDLDWNMTFSQDMGFLKSGTDVQGMVHTGEMIMRYLGCVRIPSAAIFGHHSLPSALDRSDAMG